MEIPSSHVTVMIVLCVLVLAVQAGAVFMFFRHLKKLDLH
jgi:hypothetical protein